MLPEYPGSYRNSLAKQSDKAAKQRLSLKNNADGQGDQIGRIFA
jgi:hypothetical protein